MSILGRTDREDLAENLSDALRNVHDAEMVLVRLEHFLDSCLDARSEFDAIATVPAYSRLLATIFSQSQFLTDIVCRNPEFMSWLWHESNLNQLPGRESMVSELLSQVRAVESFDHRCNTMRRFKRREILRIATRDIFAHAALASITEDLSNLADAALEAAIVCAHDNLTPRFGAPGSDCGFVVLAMGKLGGRELNFSSDIDLLFIYTDEGESTGGSAGALSHAEYFHKLGEQVIHAVSAQTGEGQVFRIDMRLRPHGRRGPLSVSLEAAIAYYELQGQAWERQAMIKARPAAGDLELGEHFIERTRPFVFPRYFDDETLEEIRSVKRQMEIQIEQRGETASEVKLGRGGIRDIEFTVQMLQLLNGGRFPELRTPNTLEAIRVLGDRNLLRPLDATMLAANYVFLRQVEHRLQIEGSQQRHVLPAQPEALDEFAGRLGYASGTSFMGHYRERAEATRRILDQFFATQGAGNLWVNDLLHPHADGSVGLSRLRALGFHDPERAREELRLLYSGPAEHPYGMRIRQQFTAIVPALLRALADSDDPDATLTRLGQVFMNLQAPGSVYDLLNWNPSLSGHLVTLVSNSEYLAEMLIRDPGLFESFGDSNTFDEAATRSEMESELEALSRAYDPSAAPYRLRDGHTLRIGMRDLIADVGVLQIGRELTQLAEVCLNHTVAAARAAAVQRYGQTKAAFAVLGLGKLGGGEMGYGSDLDLVFVYDKDRELECGLGANEYFAWVAQYIMRALKEPTRYGILYDIDARLRPDGKKGMLTISHSRLRQYYVEEAQAWERLALVKVRAVAGDDEFAKSVETEARAIAFGTPLTRESLDNIEEIRLKMVEAASPLDLKKHEGGLAEIEFTVRLLQLRHYPDYPELMEGNFAEALQALADYNLITWSNANALLTAYTVFRRIENRIRMMHGRPGTELYEDTDARADLAARLQIEGDLAEVVLYHKRVAHGIYVETLGSLINKK
ncbi:MAG: bifunctional [glutamate--ammonia ligase]-adenylyl-L-tyrosine phosphorylase/[glutamate--ammonia-ligase] adenylyltransferase [Candidatus Hydrogenedentes bacterium]|nr:bifunctional [glutamate--ammonia ligase]-adenylyl-L-tyrosine phosphorylase/[glutamate--ammonia-ligase] adenylyltransferase [Candidatus Hydrogenedentota bacterium]